MAGRPTKYQSSYAKIAKTMIKLGATEVDLAEAFGVCVKTIDNWKYSEPEFLQALKEARNNYDDAVEAALAKRAIGYSHTETKVGFYMGEPVEVEVVKHYPPDAGAAKMWLANRRPEKWRDQGADVDDVPEPVKVEINVIDASKKDADG
jgi:hypothetical protein